MTLSDSEPSYIYLAYLDEEDEMGIYFEVCGAKFYEGNYECKYLNGKRLCTRNMISKDIFSPEDADKISTELIKADTIHDVKLHLVQGISYVGYAITYTETWIDTL